MSKIDLLLHPIRIRIIMALGGQPLTPGQIAQEINDVPQTSLYRHINALLDGGIICVVDERPVRGTVEKVYALVEGATRIRADELEVVSDEDHLRYFMVFLSSLLQDFSSYLERHQGETNRMDDSVYAKTVLHLTDDQYHQLTEQFRSLALPHAAAPDEDPTAPPKRRYTFALFSIPED